MQPKVSVIIPVYNKSPYIIACLDSLKKQTYPHLEVLVIDDSSTDDSWEKLRRYVGSCIHLFQIPHSGPSAARNKGLEEATGEYVTFIDADDFVEEGYIEHLVASIGDADLCLSGNKTWFQREGRWVEEKCSPGPFLLSEHSMKRALGGIGWKLYSLPFLRAHNIIFPVDIDQGEDTLFSSFALFHALPHSSKINCIDCCEYIMRRHDLSSQIHQLVSIDVEEKVIAKYKELEQAAADENLKNYYKGQQISHLAVIGRIICYIPDMPMKEKKHLFFSLARRYGVGGGLHVDRPAQTIASLSLLTHTFLPFYIITKVFYWKSELRGRYAPPAMEKMTGRGKRKTVEDERENV